MPLPVQSHFNEPSSDPRIERAAPAFERVLLPRPISVEIDWQRWSRAIDRKRRTLARLPHPVLPATFNRRATLESFKLEGIDVTEADLDHAEAPTRDRRAFRTRTLQRLRNHLAILVSLERLLRRRQPVKTIQIVRWYTSISSGLSTASLTPSDLQRVEATVHRINSPQMRLQPAVQEIAKLHLEMLTDPIVPSFNGILARLMLQVHLGRCGLPLIAFNAATDATRITDADLLLPRLLELIDAGLNEA